jgi:hypothetical protein
MEAPADVQTTQSPADVYIAELRELFDRADAGDTSVLPELKRTFDEYPALAEMLGDMPQLALEPLLAVVAGKSLTLREAILRQSDRLLGELAGPDAPLPERMCAERVALTWVEVLHADNELAAALKKRTAESPQMQAAERRAHAAQARYLEAIEALVRVKRYS